VTAAPATSPAAVASALGNPDTVILFGNDRVNDDLRSGVRLRAGFWLDEDGQWGLDGSFFYLDPTGKNFGAGSNGTSVSLFRPIFNTATGMEGVEEVANLAAGIVGRVAVQSSSTFLGGDVNLRHALCCSQDGCRGYRLDLLAGYRTFGANDDLRVGENLVPLGLGGAPAGTILVEDHFRTRNQFHGFQLGLDGQWWWQRWFLGARGLAAFGVTEESVAIDGATSAQPVGGTPVVAEGGLLALVSNIGRYHRDPFAFAPSLEVKAGCQVTSGIRVTLGYDLMYCTNVARAGDQIDLAVNPNLEPPVTAPLTPLRPAFQFHGSDYWAQGLSFGVELRY
jgi:hypothetical protein